MAKKKKRVVPMSTRIKRLKKKCDIALQNYYRNIGGDCEACSKPMHCVHHHIPVSRSSYLRYKAINLVRICSGCHMQHHNGDPKISHAYRQGKAPEWENNLFAIQHTPVKYTEEQLKEILEGYKI
jgi:hypothetical protein